MFIDLSESSSTMEEDVYLDGVEDWQNLQPLNLNLDSMPVHKTYSKLWSMVVIKDSSSTKDVDDDFSVFPPCNHENLIPSHFNSQPKTRLPTPPLPPSSSSSPLSFLPSDFEPSPSLAVSPLPKWWSFTLQILRSRIAKLGSYFGSNCGSGNKRSFWSFGNVALAVTVVLWWLRARARRQWRRRKRVEHLMQIITEKDEKIMQLLSQIAQMNEVLLNRHKALASKLAN